MSLSPDALFLRCFWPMYPQDGSMTEVLRRVREVDANPGRNPGLLAHLDDAAERFVENAGRASGLDLRLDGTDASVHRLSACLTPERRDRWLEDGRAGTPDNALFNVVIHGAAYVGACIVRHHEGAWGVRRPLWESIVRLRSAAGEGDLAIFHWWLKALADGGDATLADRYRAHVEVPCAPVFERPVWVSGHRALPRLKQPTYDRLHKYLRAHLPELRGVGDDFPSAERFSAYAFRWMDTLVVGEGRAVVLALASGAGLHLFWLGPQGFEKAALFSADAFPEPLVRVHAGRLLVMTGQDGQQRTHEMLWWGP